MKRFTAKEVAALVNDDTVLLVLSPDTEFELRDVDLSSLDVQDKQNIERLRSLQKLSLEKWLPLVVAPPIIIDGNHRVVIAKSRDVNCLKAFVAINPQW